MARDDPEGRGKIGFDGCSSCKVSIEPFVAMSVGWPLIPQCEQFLSPQSFI